MINQFLLTNKQTLEKLIEENEENNNLLLVKFFTDNCLPCKEIKKNIDNFLNEEEEKGFLNITIVEINALNFPNLCSNDIFNVVSVPSLFLFKKGLIIKKKIGLMNKDELKEFFYNL